VSGKRHPIASKPDVSTSVVARRSTLTNRNTSSRYTADIVIRNYGDFEYGPSALTTPTDITLRDSKRDLMPAGFCRPGPLRPPDFKLQRECSIVRDFLTIKKRLVHNMQAKGLLRAVRWLLGYSG
jgi:hypothetical protein